MQRLRIAVGLPLVYPGILIAPYLANHLYMSAGGTQSSFVHYALVLIALIGSPWLGMKVLNGAPE